MVDHLQCGDEGVVFEGASEQAKLNGVVVIEIDRNVSAVAAAFRFLQDLLAGLFKAESCTPSAHVVAASAAECEDEIMKVHNKVKKLTGYDMKVFRPPYGDYNDVLIESAEKTWRRI